MDELDATRREQLRLAGERFDGETRPLDARLAEDAENGAWQHVVLADAADGTQAPRFDVWLRSDSGTCFEAGTTTVVAERVHGALTSPDAALADALDAALG